MRQHFCNISSISKGGNDFTYHQLKDYDVFIVKKLEIRPTEKNASKIPKVRGEGGQREAFGKKLTATYLRLKAFLTYSTLH